jgi:hypothetical protein
MDQGMADADPAPEVKSVQVGPGEWYRAPIGDGAGAANVCAHLCRGSSEAEHLLGKEAIASSILARGYMGKAHDPDGADEFDALKRPVLAMAWLQRNGFTYDQIGDVWVNAELRMKVSSSWLTHKPKRALPDRMRRVAFEMSWTSLAEYR